MISQREIAQPTGVDRKTNRRSAQALANSSGAALEGDQGFIGTMVRAFRARHDYAAGALKALRGVTCLPAQGTLYLFPDIRRAQAAAGHEDHQPRRSSGW